MKLEERIRRNVIEDKLYIGELVETHINSEFGTLLKLIINGIIAEELMASRGNHQTSADRHLGRIEGLSTLQERLDYCIEEKNILTEEHKATQIV